MEGVVVPAVVCVPDPGPVPESPHTTGGGVARRALSPSTCRHGPASRRPSASQSRRTYRGAWAWRERGTVSGGLQVAPHRPSSPFLRCHRWTCLSVSPVDLMAGNWTVQSWQAATLHSITSSTNTFKTAPKASLGKSLPYLHNLAESHSALPALQASSSTTWHSGCLLGGSCHSCQHCQWQVGQLSAISVAAVTAVNTVCSSVDNCQHWQLQLSQLSTLSVAARTAGSTFSGS